ncbi:hypothetical protein ACOSQ2_011951 [Xanthoceras sorbifolium]
MDPEEIARRCANLSLSERDVPVARVGANLQEKGKKELSMALIGKLITNKEVHKESFKAAIASIWKTRKGVVTESLGTNLFIFTFKCLWDRKRVLEGGAMVLL